MDVRLGATLAFSLVGCGHLFSYQKVAAQFRVFVFRTHCLFRVALNFLHRVLLWNA